MSKKILILSLVLFGVVLSPVAEKCLADAMGQLQQAQDYKDKGYISQAETIYKSIAENNPGTDYAFNAYKGLASLYVRTEQTAAASEIISRLTADYSAYPDLPQVLNDLARNSATRRAYEQAKSIYEQLRQQYPASSYADSAAVGIAKVNIMFQIESSRYAEAEAAVSTMAADFAGNSDLPQALFDIAGRYRTKRKYKEAKNIYQLIQQSYTGTSWADKSQLEMARIEVMSLIRAGFDAQAAAAIDKLCEDFATNPDLPGVLYGIAGRYRGWAKYDKAIGVFEKVIERCPESSYVEKARLNIARCNVLSLIKKGKHDESVAAYSEMVAEFPGCLGLRGALSEIAKHYEQAEKYDLAQQVYSRTAADYSGSTFALKAQKHLIYMQIRTEQFTEAQQVVAKLSQDFAGHSDLPQALNDIGIRYNKKGRHQQAEICFQHVAQQYTDSHVAEESRLNLSFSQILRLIDSEDHDTAFAAIEKLIADFRGNWHLPWALAYLADQYCTKAVDLLNQDPDCAEDYFQKAITLYEKVADRFPNAPTTPRALCGLGKCYRKMADYEKAQQFYTKVVNDYPESDHAWSALHLMARTYEDMGENGSLDKQQALTQAKAAYQRLLQEYPDCKVAATTRNWLTRHGSN